MELKRRYAECFDGFEGFERPYDPLLDDFEPGMSTAEVGAVLEALGDGTRPLVAEIAERGDAVDDSCLHGHFPVDAQAALAREVVADLPLEEGAWRLDPTAHPFATAISPSDIRITTRFDEGVSHLAVVSNCHAACREATKIAGSYGRRS